MVLVKGLYAPAGQFLPPLQDGHDNTSWPRLVKTSSAFSVTAPVAPSISLITFCATVGVAQRNSPVSRSSVYTTPVFPGIPVTTLRTSLGRSRGLTQETASASGARARCCCNRQPSHGIFGRSARVRVSLVAPGLCATSAALKMMAWIAFVKNPTS